MLVLIVLMLSFSCSSPQMRSPAHPSKLPCPLTGTSSAEQGSATDLGLYLGWDDSFFTFTFSTFNNQKCAAVWPLGSMELSQRCLGSLPNPFDLCNTAQKAQITAIFQEKSKERLSSVLAKTSQQSGLWADWPAQAARCMSSYQQFKSQRFSFPKRNFC